MEKLASFTIDHNKLPRGIDLSRQDTIGKEIVSTFGIRIKEPNREPVMRNAPLLGEFNKSLMEVLTKMKDANPNYPE